MRCQPKSDSEVTHALRRALLLATMSFPSPYRHVSLLELMPSGPCTPSAGPSSRTSITGLGGTLLLDYRWSEESIQPDRQSISNSSVHTTSAVGYKDQFDLLGQGLLPPSSNQNSSVLDLKYCDSLEKSSFCVRNETRSSISTFLRGEPDPCSTTTPSSSTQKLESSSLRLQVPPVEDDAASQSSPPWTLRASQASTLSLIKDPISQRQQDKAAASVERTPDTTPFPREDMNEGKGDEADIDKLLKALYKDATAPRSYCDLVKVAER